MIIRNIKEVEAVEASQDGASPAIGGIKIRVMLGEEQGAPNFVLRHFTLEPGGNSPRHSHEWEHEVYVLEGEGAVFGNGRETPIAPGDAILVPGNEEHQFKAAGDKPLVFLCIIPRQ